MNKPCERCGAPDNSWGHYDGIVVAETAWRTDEPPRDGSWIVGVWKYAHNAPQLTEPFVARFRADSIDDPDKWDVAGNGATTRDPVYRLPLPEVPR